MIIASSANRRTNQSFHITHQEPLRKILVVFLHATTLGSLVHVTEMASFPSQSVSRPPLHGHQVLLCGLGGSRAIP